MLSRDEVLRSKTTVSFYLEGPIAIGIQPYLVFIANVQHRFYLTRLRLNTLHYLFAFPKRGKWCANLPKCPCDGRSTQSTLLLLLFCNFYKESRKSFLRPIFRENVLYSYKAGFKYIRNLEKVSACNAVICYIMSATKQRNELVHLEKLNYETI